MVQSELLAHSLATPILPTTAQEARCFQLSKQVIQLRGQGKAAEPIPLAQKAVSMAQATHGPDNPHVGLSLNEFGLLLKDQETFRLQFPARQAR